MPGDVNPRAPLFLSSGSRGGIVNPFTVRGASRVKTQKKMDITLRQLLITLSNLMAFA
jgi:hypothetical protein